MRFSQSSKYAVLAMIRLAGTASGPLTVHQLAGESLVPEPYLAKLTPVLVRAGLLAAARGRGGGLVLARPAEAISLADVIRAIDGEAVFEDCLFTAEPCSGSPNCPLGRLYDPVRDGLTDFLESTTIAAVAAQLGLRPRGERGHTDG